MGNNSKLPKRSEIPEEYKWKLEDIYASDELWEEDFKKIKELASSLPEYKGTLSKSSDNLLKCLISYFDMSRIFEKLYVYAHMKSHEDTARSVYQSLASRADSLNIAVSSSSSFIVPEILSIKDETLDKFINENKSMELYKKYLDEVRRMKPHVLSASEEELLAMAGELYKAPGTIFGMINNADIKFPEIKDENGNIVELTKGRYTSLIESRDRKVRKDAFDALYETYSKQKNTFAATLSANVRANIFNSKVRKYSSPREASLFEDNIDVKVYDNLIEAIHNNFDLMHRYMSLRKKLLGVDELHMYDVYTPIVMNVDKKIPYKEAAKTVEVGLEALGSQYIKDLKSGLNSGWVDVYENEGKRSGAYSWGCYDSHPYVLLNHNDTLDSMFTIAHEMGHSMHSYYSNLNQPYIYAGYKIFVAEVASTLNEALLMNYLLKNTNDKTEKMYLLNHYMEQFRTTVYRQTMFAEFEKIIHEKAEEGAALTCEALCKIYHDLNVQYYGPDMVVDDYIDMEWARIPHFYTSFYVYKYATGFSAAVSLSQQIINEGQSAVDRYLNFLKSGGSDYPIELLKKAGVDMNTPEPVSNALSVFKGLLDEMEKLVYEK